MGWFSKKKKTIAHLIPDPGDVPLTPGYSKIAGVTMRNDNGIERQDIIAARCEEGDALALVREPDNEFDYNAIAVYHIGGDGKAFQLGYIGAELAEEMAERLDDGAPVTARITDITGGKPGKPTLGVNIEITKYRKRRRPCGGSS